MSAHKTNIGLDLVRGLAALLVVLGHTRSMIAAASGEDLTATVAQKLALLPTSFAQESVAVFFVLSGYLVGGQVLKHVRQSRFSWRKYMVKRFTRLWVVLVPGIVVTLILDSLTSRLFPAAWGRFPEPSGLDAGTALCNVAFLQRAHCQPYGSNDSLWSLSYEFWFYVLFPACALAVASLWRKSWKGAIAPSAIAIGVFLVFGPHILAYIPSWLMGVAVAAIHSRWKTTVLPAWSQRRSHYLLVAAVGLCIAAMLASNVIDPSNELRFIMVGLASMPMVLLLAVRPPGHRSETAVRVSKLGLWSFSIYVFHLPLVKLAVAATVNPGGYGAITNTALVYILGVAVTLTCVPLWFLFERHTDVARYFLLNRQKVSDQSP